MTCVKCLDALEDFSLADVTFNKAETHSEPSRLLNHCGELTGPSHPVLYSVLWSRDHGLETRVHSSSFCPGLGLGLGTWRPRSRSLYRDLKSKVSVSWSRDSMLGAYACSTITVICSTFKRVLCHQLELMQPMLWSRDSNALEFILSRPRSWSWDLKKVLATTLIVLRY